MGVFRVEVKDSGAGLSEEEQRKIFGEFTQFNKNELQGGGTYSPLNLLLLNILTLQVCR